MTISWPFSRQQVLDDSGRPLLIPRVNFYAGGTTNPITVYKDPARTQPHTQPVEADGFGRFPRVYLPDGLYREEVLGPYGDLLWNDDGLGEVVIEDKTAPTTPNDPNAVFRTGDTKWRLDASIQPGWVRMNTRTIGGAGSGATELADASAKDLFVYLWSTFGEDIASVIGGRGVTALGDFAAGKAITVPSMQGLGAAGLDDMGSSPVNRLQWTTNLALTAGSTAAQVVNPSGIVLGSFVTAPGVSAGTIVIDINGGNIVLSQPAASGSTGTVSGRFSRFGDAQMPGAFGGVVVEGIGLRNLPADLPDGEVTVSYPAHTYAREANLIGASTGAGAGTVDNLHQGQVPAQTVPPSPQPFPVPITNPGGGVPISTLQPTRLGTFYMKL